MSSNSGHTYASPEDERLNRKRESAQPGPVLGTPSDMAGVLRHLQRTAGNRAVNTLLRQAAERQSSGPAIQRSASVQRDDTGDGGTPAGAEAAGAQQAKGASGEQTIALPLPESVTVPIEGGYGPGDYEVPSNQTNVMAKHLDASMIQRDDTPPQGSSSGGASGGGGQPDNNASVQNTVTAAGPRQAAYQMQVTRTIHLIPPLSLDKLHIDFFQDPQVSVGVDSQGTLTTQVAQNLFTAHFLRNWKAPVDASLAAFYQQNIWPNQQSQQGLQGQAEAKITKTLSVTFTLQGMRTDSEDGKSRVWGVTGATGVIAYF